MSLLQMMENAGPDVHVTLSATPPPDGAATQQLTTLQPWQWESDLVVDALLGYGQRSASRGEAAALIA